MKWRNLTNFKTSRIRGIDLTSIYKKYTWGCQELWRSDYLYRKSKIRRSWEWQSIYSAGSTDPACPFIFKSLNRRQMAAAEVQQLFVLPPLLWRLPDVSFCEWSLWESNPVGVDLKGWPKSGGGSGWPFNSNLSPAISYARCVPVLNNMLPSEVKNPLKHYNNISRPATTQFSSVTQLCPILCDPRDCSTPGIPFYHQLPELCQNTTLAFSKVPGRPA